jgi:hypothetical protein
MRNLLIITLKTTLTCFLLIQFFSIIVNAQTLSSRLSGKILLQVEGVGQAWYIDPNTGTRAFLGRPSDAFRIMRELGLGISETNFNKFNYYAPKNLAGRILLRVQANGEAYYVNPDTLKMHYLGRPDDAFKVMRELGLGIKNNDLVLIPIFEKYKEENIENIITKSQNPVQTFTLEQIAKGVGHIVCYTSVGGFRSISEGSATIWDLGNGLENSVLTNEHVIATNHCQIATDGGLIHFLNLKEKRLQWNNHSDALVTTIDDVRENFFKISSLEKCSTRMERGSQVYILGYPVYTAKTYEELPGIMGVHMPVLSITEGIISGHDIYVENLPYVNYYVSAKIDSGNSGGLALAKVDNNYCVLGIPTWLSIGNYENQGVIQNIHNITYSQN